MHLLATQAVTLDETAQAVDLEQSPADVVVLSFSDSDLTVVSAALASECEGMPAFRLASLKKLKHPMSVDLYIERVVGRARAVLVRSLGGLDYWRYGIERISRLARERGIVFVALPGDDRPDPRLADLSTADAETIAHIDLCFRYGGPDNVRQALRSLVATTGVAMAWRAPQALEAAVVLDEEGRVLAADELRPCADPRPLALVVFYRASLMAADTAAVMALMRSLTDCGLRPLAVAVSSLKDPAVAPVIESIFAHHRPAITLNTTAFSALRSDETSVLDAAGVPVLQVVLSGSTREAWSASPRGLSATDLAMNVVLPELDGRILSRAISFKSEALPEAALEYARVRHEPDAERVGFVARQAAAWVKLGRTPRHERRIALMLSDYPDRGGRTGYAVGLDTAASVVEIVSALRSAGYETGEKALTRDDVEAMLRGDARCLSVPLPFYRDAVQRLPESLQQGLFETWGEAASDPNVSAGAFSYPHVEAGNVLILLQPDRGAAAGRKSGYHDTTVPPRHAYVALYEHLRSAAKVDAIVHLGTHGTLEWLPGKALALSSGCWPEALVGALPVVYPFIVNNPGEAAQAKRRLSAVTIGHLTPPLSAAGLYGRMANLEALIEEYAEADGVDPRRMTLIEDEIVASAWASGLAQDCGLVRDEPARSAIAKLDAELCDIKDLSVRDRLHVFGRAPEPDAAADLAHAIRAAFPDDTDTAPSLSAVTAAVTACGGRERAALIAALDGERIAPGPSGAPSRGRSDVLPTGRNLTSTDPRAIPTRTAAVIGQRAAQEVVRRYLQDHGDYPTSLVLDLWASPALRTGGDDLAQALAYLGARPVWDTGSHRVTGIEILPLALLDRPRIDVTLRLSGLFRDLFETQIALFDMAVRQVAELAEDAADNPLAGALRRGESLVRIFGGGAGSYGAGVATVALDSTWGERADLGRAYLDNAEPLTGSAEGEAAAHFRDRVKDADALVHTQDDRERDLLDGDGVADFVGGFAAAAHLLGQSPALYHLDTSRTSAPKARTLAEEVRRVVRGRLTHPRWIAGMMQHGHRGVAEIAQAVDALYAFSASANVVPGHVFDATHEALIGNHEVFGALVARNPAAAEAMALRLKDALTRGLWISRRNATAHELDAAIAEARGCGGGRVEAAQ